MPDSQTTTYADALEALSVRDGFVVVRKPDVVLAHYSDGWRYFARFAELGGKVRATSYTIDPVAAIAAMTPVGDIEDGYIRFNPSEG